MHPSLEKILIQTESSLPIIIDETSACELATLYCGYHITTIDECKSGSFPGVFLIEKEEEKKHLSITDIRRWIADVSQISYEKKALYMLRDFDHATHEAMNACLKVLEEPPKHAIILLIVTTPESLIETIRSRCLNLYKHQNFSALDASIREAIIDYNHGKRERLLTYVYASKKLEKNEVISILAHLIPEADSIFLAHIEEGLRELFRVNETPRNILDRVLLSNSIK